MKNFILKPVNQITVRPDAKISTAVPRSGWEATNKTGINKTKIGIIKCLILATFSLGILL